tara:strand:+ start:22 stop:249 length:228 start_codon:yes stop_codon:yes gene_type:complete
MAKTIEITRVSDVRIVEGREVVFLGSKKQLTKLTTGQYKMNGAYDSMIPVEGNEEIIKDLREDISKGETVSLELA